MLFRIPREPRINNRKTTLLELIQHLPQLRIQGLQRRTPPELITMMTEEDGTHGELLIPEKVLPPDQTMKAASESSKETSATTRYSLSQRQSFGLADPLGRTGSMKDVSLQYGSEGSRPSPGAAIPSSSIC